MIQPQNLLTIYNVFVIHVSYHCQCVVSELSYGQSCLVCTGHYWLNDHRLLVS